MKTLTEFWISSRFKTGTVRSFCALLCLLLPFLVSAQEEKEVQKDTTTTLLSDSVRIDKGKKVIDIETYAARFNPRKALLYSAVFPGMGQVYNRKYWKLPIVYGGFVGGIYVITAYQGLYSEQRAELFTMLNKIAADPTGSYTSKDGYTETQLRTLINNYRRQRDYMIILTGVWYVLQLVDAHVDAHLKEFDLNPELKRVKASIEPMMDNSRLTGRNTGVSLIIKF